MFRGTFGMRRPVGRQHENISPQKGKHASYFRKRSIIADVHADSQSMNLLDRERQITRVDKHVNAQKGQVHLAIDPQQPLGADQETGVEEARAIPLEQSEDAAAAGSSGKLGDFAHLATIAGHRVRQAFFPTAEAISRKRTLGEDDEFRPVFSRPLETCRGYDRGFPAIFPSFGSICTPATRTVCGELMISQPLRIQWNARHGRRPLILLDYFADLGTLGSRDAYFYRDLAWHKQGQLVKQRKLRGTQADSGTRITGSSLFAVAIFLGLPATYSGAEGPGRIDAEPRPDTGFSTIRPAAELKLTSTRDIVNELDQMGLFHPIQAFYSGHMGRIYDAAMAVVSRDQQYKLVGDDQKYLDPTTEAHESLHGMSSLIRRARGWSINEGYDVVYVGNGKFASVRVCSGITKGQVSAWLPRESRDSEIVKIHLKNPAYKKSNVALIVEELAYHLLDGKIGLENHDLHGTKAGHDQCGDSAGGGVVSHRAGDGRDARR